MKKVIRLTERDLVRIVKRVINEQTNQTPTTQTPVKQTPTELTYMKGIKYVGTFSDEASGRVFQVVKAFDLKCGVTELQMIEWDGYRKSTAKPLNNKIVYLYIETFGRPSVPNDLSTKKSNDLYVRATNPCDFNKLGEFGTLQNTNTYG